ncbi:hypothetical protein GC105_08900 [Alkalibaculum sp. M08DMB]|uniref:Uncharacterized protein n=1 Tax=Alkalibaculum sporogenes TaxID=2655001 RepID=A0A6A7K9N9_9FIRM|nr:hypothetical protein [Alkalibaculum sporogenes]MPW25907.1 hypothetical protein [Alkalibaculum sporogenes]
MYEKDSISKNNQNESTSNWQPKGHSQVPMHRKAFPLDDIGENTELNIVSTGFNASYSEDNGDVLEAVKPLDAYLHPKNQILLRALIKANSLVHDVSYLMKIKQDASITEVSAKPLTVKEGIQIAEQMSPYLPINTKHQLNSVMVKLNTIENLKSGLENIQKAESPEIKIEYILDNLKHFITHEKYNQIKQIVNIVKIFQTSSELADKNNSTDDDIELQQSEEERKENENEQLSDLMGMIDKFTSKKNTE